MPTMATAAVFPGQGAQRPGMGRPWVGTDGWAIVDDLSEHTGVDVGHLLLDADAETLRRTDLAQVVIFAASMVAFTQARADGGLDRVDAFAGHSVGEYAALVAAGALSLPAGARLVAARGRAMRAAAVGRPGTMAALVGRGAERAGEFAERARASGGEVWVANLNGPGQVVVSGTVAGVDRLRSLAGQAGVKAVSLEVAGAFHCPLMAGAVDGFAGPLADEAFTDRHRPVVANVDARPHTAGADWPSLASRQITAPVRWEEAVRELAAAFGVRRFVDLGPGRVVAGMIRRIGPDWEVAPIPVPVPGTAPPPDR